MKSARTTRTLAVIASAGLLVGAFAGTPAEAAKKKKKKKPAACAAFVPGEAGADKPALVVTDAATEAAPVSQTVTLDMVPAEGAVVPESRDYFNVQVDSAAAEAGLYGLIEFPTRRDYDLEFLHPDGSYAARSHDFNTLWTGTPADAETAANGGHGGEATDSSEKIVGIRTSDCGGYTVEVVNWLGEGGELTVKLWLGEIKHDPQAEGEEVPD